MFLGIRKPSIELLNMKIFKISQNNVDPTAPLDNNVEYEDYESVKEALEFEGRYVAREIIEQLVAKKQLKVDNIAGLLKIEEDGKVFFFEDDDDSLSFINDPCSWISNMQMDNALEILGSTEDKLYMSAIGCSLKDLRQNPGSTYHWTTEKGWGIIQSTGKLLGSYGTGINNRSAYGIFTSIEPDEYAGGTYGDVCLEIDLAAFQKDSGQGELELDVEPEILENTIKESLAYKLGVECHVDEPNDVSPFTVIVNHVIPLKYVKRLN